VKVNQEFKGIFEILTAGDVLNGGAKVRRAAGRSESAAPLIDSSVG